LADNHKKKNNPQFGDINKPWLEEYEKWMRDKNASWSTVGIYARNLRRVFNRARKTNVIPESCYPFGKDVYIIPSSVNIKKALTYKQVNQIFHYDCSKKNPKNEPYQLRGALKSMEKWRDFWILSYLCSGVNFKDVAAWKWKNLKKNRIRFVRQKTRRSTKGQIKEIEIVLSDVVMNILNQYCNKDRSPESYIFPFYTDKMSADKKLRVSNQQIKNINTWIGRIAKNLEFDFKPTYQSARHSFATISRNAGVDKEYIQKSLGHQDSKTTDSYLDSFEENKIKENQSHLLDTDSKTYLKVVNG
jgi:integrase